ncbi:MAG TPA: UDP-N-acetylglucosamine 1-carboxyvinyltransferase [Planctomycetota bacterium]|nr:UDP-N-acetylglucosamine 1-carboxyvinyltransferase [Planctomycetota bacterium]
MDAFLIEGGRPLRGSVEVRGAKNAALPMMAASLLLGEGKLVLRRVPNLSDIKSMVLVLQQLGIRIDRRGDEMTLQVASEKNSCAPYELVSKMRASVCVLGPLVGKRRQAEVSMPGGCSIGDRPIDLHLKGLAALGASVAVERGYVYANAKRLAGGSMYLGGPYGSTVTGTENVMMAAVLAPGTTVIECAACEPEVQECARLLVKMGARIEGIGSPRLTIHGVRKLHGCTHDIIADRIEAGTFMAAAAMTGGDVSIERVNPDHLMCVTECMKQAGAIIETGADWIRVRGNGMFRPVNVATLPYPGFPTDMQAQYMALMTRGEGISIITERIYPERFHHVRELGRMGANIVREGPSAIVIGAKELSGAPVMASDLRAAAGLLVAALAARGETCLQRIYHLDRGYDQIEKRLESLGARIRRVDLKPETGSSLREAV